MRSIGAALAAMLVVNGSGTPAAADCGALAILKIEAANPLSAAEVPPSGEMPAYCRLLGFVRPAINFEIRLPTTDSNGEFYMSGCGGFCGTAAGGLQQARDVARLFMVPGMDHCGINAKGPGIGDEGIDPLTALENWIEHGVAPEALLASKAGAGGGLPLWQRPVCAWPQQAEFAGGDPRLAESYRCGA